MGFTKAMAAMAASSMGIFAAVIPGGHAAATPRWKTTTSTTVASTTTSTTTSTTVSSPSPLFSENFDGLPLGTNWVDGSAHGQWTSVYNGYGQNGIALDGATQVLSESPEVSTSSSQTHAGLVTSGPTFGNMDLTAQVRTVAQLRLPTPNAWEVGWVLWHYTDDTHFYYLALKPNGWELGKEDPAYPGAQRFLATGSSPTYPVGPWYNVEVKQVSGTITVWANGVQLASLTDTQNPYLSGSLGLYCEDSNVHFDNVKVTAAS